jgi:orotate phosphoribosyltransferase
LPITNLKNPMVSIRRGNPEAVLEMLALPGTLMEGHFRLVSGLHSDRFLAFSQIAAEPENTELLASWLAPSLEPRRPDTVIAPSTAGVGLASALARRLGAVLQLASLGGDGRPEGVIAEESLTARKVLLVNDVVTTGESLQRMAKIVRERGGEITGASWFLSRAEVDISSLIEAPAEAVGTIELDAWKPEECQLCAAGVELREAVDLN